MKIRTENLKVRTEIISWCEGKKWNDYVKMWLVDVSKNWNEWLVEMWR